MRIRIKPPTVRDVSYVAAHMRACDWAEIECQLPEGATPADVAGYALSAGAMVAHLDGEPVACFGFVARSCCVLEAWAWGRDGMERTIPAITRHVARHLMPKWLEAGVRRLEARSIITHVEAHRWMLATGAVMETPLPDVGRRGESFLQFAWTIAAMETGGRARLARFLKDRA